VIGRTRYADMRRMEEIIMASGLDWTIVRPAMLMDERGPQGYRAEPGYIVPGAFAPARASLADFLVGAVGEGRHVGQALAVATPGITLVLAVSSIRWDSRAAQTPGCQDPTRMG
jgi:uncharacterized protein YbjT (DUF2867 family)